MRTEKTLRRGAGLAGALIVTAMLTTGCNGVVEKIKKMAGGEQAEPPAETVPETVPVAVAPPASASAEPTAGVVRYPDETAESGTVATHTFARVRKAADDSSEELTQLGAGTNVTRTARKGAYTLVMWPSGPGQLSPGWIPTSALSDAKAVATAAATATATATAAATTTATTAATAAPTAVTTVDAGTIANIGAKVIALIDAGAAAVDAGAAATTAQADAGGVRVIGAIAPPGGRPPGPITLPGKR